MEILAGIYIVIGLLSYVYSIRQIKKTSYVTFEDLFMGCILFGAAWPIGIPAFWWNSRDIGGAILDWVNKK